MSRAITRRATLALALLLSGAAGAATYDTGATDAEIKIGISGPESGPAAAFSAYLRGFRTYFAAVNDAGGLNGRKVNVVTYDDAYSPAKALEVTRKLVESDGVLLVAGSVGTATAIAVQRYLNERKVPQLFVLAGSPRLNAPQEYPWSSVGIPTYDQEGKVLAEAAAKRDGAGKIAVLYQDDEAGQTFLAGIEKELGPKLVARQSYAVTDPNVDSQMITLRSSGATSVILVTTPKHTALALRRIKALGWSPAVYITSGGSSVSAALVPAGVDAAKGVMGGFFRKPAGDPGVANDPDVNAYQAAAAKAFPGSDVNNDFMQLGYVTASFTGQVLKQADDDLTRANVMRQAASLKSFEAPLLLPGITANTSPANFAPVGNLKLMQFDGQQYRLLAD